MLALKRDDIPLRIVGLNPADKDVALFKRLTGGAPVVRAGTLQPGPQPRNHTPFPWTLVMLALLAAVGSGRARALGAAPRVEDEFVKAALGFAGAALLLALAVLTALLAADARSWQRTLARRTMRSSRARRR